MTRILKLFGLASLGLIGLNGQAAPLTNGDFLNGTVGWDALGDVSVQSGSAWVSNASTTFEDDYPAAAGTFNFSGVSAASVGVVGSVEDFVGVALGALDPDIGNGIAAYEGSALRQTFSVNAGDTLSFLWNFHTNEGAKQDYGFFVLDGVVSGLGLAGQAAQPGSPFSLQTGLAGYATQFVAAGTHTLAFGVVDVEDFNVSSALEISNVQITPVPEPAQWLMMLLGVSVLALTRRQD